MTADSAPRLRVLVVDDNPDVADSTALLLTVSGFEPLVRYDGPAALAAVETFRPGVCLIDLNMPGMAGDELATSLLPRLGERVLLVALTAQSDAAACDRIRAAGFHLHLVKPVDPYKLLQVVDAQWRLWASSSPVVR